MEQTPVPPETLEAEDFSRVRYALNRYQLSNNFHPFTCGHRDDHPRVDRLDTGLLVATDEGWICPHCDYRQDWAWAGMADEPFTLRTLRTIDPARAQVIWDALGDHLCRSFVALHRLRQLVRYPDRLDPMIEDARRLRDELFALRPSMDGQDRA